MIYLDHNATAPILPAVADAVRECLLSVHANASSQHGAGRAARRRLQTARERVIELLGASNAGMAADRLILTSGGTESNNLALRGTLRPAAAEGGHLVISAIEHPSVAAAADALAREGVAVDRAPVDRHGVVDVDQLEALLRPETRLVSVMLANNETGVVQPVAEIVRRCSPRGIPVHTDATQAVGKVSINFAELGVAMLTFTAHKFHGPVGIGGLLVRPDVGPLELLAGQTGMERPGTPAVALAVGMQTALDAWHAEAAERKKRMSDLRNRFERTVLESVPGTQVVGADAERLPHTSNLAFVGYDRQALVIAFDRAGIACSTGSACASGSSEPSPVLLAMGLTEEVVRGSLRFSLGALTTAAEIDQAATQIGEVCSRLQPGVRP